MATVTPSVLYTAVRHVYGNCNSVSTLHSSTASLGQL